MSTVIDAESTVSPAPERLTYTVEEAGKLLGVGRQAAYEAARTGSIPALRIGRRLVVPRDALSRLLGSGQSATNERQSVA